MRRWLIGAFLVWVVMPVAAASVEAKLGNMKCVFIVIENADSDEKSFGLDRDTLSESVLVATRAKLPRLQIKETCSDATLYLNVTILLGKKRGGGHTGDYSGMVVLTVRRGATILATGQYSAVTVSDWKMVINGLNENVKKHVLEVIEEQVGEFAAAYYKAGNE